MMNEAVHSIMSTNLITIAPTTKLSEVRKVFMENRIHHLPVTEGSKLVGIITTYDLWKNKIAPDEYSSVAASSVMNTRIATLQPSDKIGTAAEVFLDNRFHALPIVNEDDILIGIITSFDVMKYQFKREYPNPILFKHLFEDNPSTKGSRMSA